MAINSVLQNYLSMTNSNGTVGYNGGVTVSYEDSILTFNEADGDTYTINAKDLSDKDIKELSAQLNADIKTDEAGKTEKASATNGTLDANKAKMQELEGQWGSLSETAKSIKETVEELSENIKKELDKAFKEQEKITEEEQTRIQEFVSTQIEQFKKDKENGKNVSLTDLQSSINEGMSAGGFDEAMSSLVSGLVVTNSKMKQMDILLNELGNINGQLKTLDTQMCDLQDVIDKQEAEAAAAAKCCDPIGFTDENGATFEFVIDKDNNGELSNFSEFLGSENFFDEMIALDADNSGDVTADEMDKAGVKVLVTEKDGTQTMKSLEEAFGGKDVNVDLNSYKEAGDGAKAANGQTLLGNFNINVGDSNYEGYSTLDTAEYLTSNYKFTDENPVNAGIGGAVKEGAEAENVTEKTQFTNDIDAFIEDYTGKLEEFQAQFDQLTEILGLDKELIESINELSQASAEVEAQSIINNAKLQEEKEAEKAEEEKQAEEEEKKEEELQAAA